MLLFNHFYHDDDDEFCEFAAVHFFALSFALLVFCSLCTRHIYDMVVVALSVKNSFFNLDYTFALCVYFAIIISFFIYL